MSDEKREEIITKVEKYGEWAKREGKRVNDEKRREIITEGHSDVL